MSAFHEGDPDLPAVQRVEITGVSMAEENPQQLKQTPRIEHQARLLRSF
jgi:hypothetical protein